MLALMKEYNDLKTDQPATRVLHQRLRALRGTLQRSVAASRLRVRAVSLPSCASSAPQPLTRRISDTLSLGRAGGRMSASIELRGLTKIFGSGPDAVHAFGPADLQIEPASSSRCSARRAAASRR